MQISVKDFRAIKTAEFEAKPGNIVLVTGENEAGKTSLVRAVRLAVSGAGVKPAVAKTYLRAGCAAALAEIVTPAGSVRVTFPDGKTATAGHAPHAPPLASGLESLMTLPKADRISALTDILKSAPTERDLVRALIALDWPEDAQARVMRRKGVPEADISVELERKGVATDEIGQICRQLSIDGWDNLHARAIDTGRRLKAEWESATGTAYGKQKAASWLPTGWPPGFVGDDAEALGAELAAAKAALEAALRGAGASGADRQAKTDLAEKIPALSEAVTKALDALGAAVKASEESEAKVRALPPTSEPPAQDCPHCKKRVAILMKGGQVTLAATGEPLSETDLRERRSAKAKADGDHANLISKVGLCRRDLATAEADLKAAQAAKAWLAANPEGPEGESGAEADVQALRDREAGLANLIRMVNTRNAADRAHRAICRQAMLVEVLAPGGLRRASLVEALKAFNDNTLSVLSGFAEWKAVGLHLIDDTVDLSYGAWPFDACSASAQWRAQVILQIGIAVMVGADLVLIDGGDILADPAARLGLFNACLDHPFPVIVTVAYPDSAAAEVPDLAAEGVGLTLVIRDGVAQPLDAVAAADGASE